MGLDYGPEDLTRKIEVETEKDTFGNRVEVNWGMANNILAELDSTLAHLEKIGSYPMIQNLLATKLGLKFGSKGSPPFQEDNPRPPATAQFARVLALLEAELGDVPIAQAIEELLKRYGNVRLSQLKKLIR